MRHAWCGLCRHLVDAGAFTGTGAEVGAQPLPYPFPPPESNGTNHELQRAVTAMAQQGKLIKDLKAQLEGTIAQLKAAQEALVAGDEPGGRGRGSDVCHGRQCR